MSGRESAIDVEVAESPFLSAVLAAYRRRRKALKNKVRALEIRAIPEAEPEKGCPLEIECGLGPRTTIRIKAWADRWIWFDARQGSKSDGWLWAATCQGRIFGQRPDLLLIEALEESISAAFEMTSSETDRILSVWAPLLALGPRE